MVLARTIMLGVEPPPSDASDPHLELLRRAGSVFAIDQRAVLGLSRLGIRARLVRPGYTRLHDHFCPERERPIDAVFLGAHTLRRTRYLNRAAEVLARLNCRMHIAPPEPAAGETPSFLADSRWRLLEQTKVVINLHSGEQTRLEWRRVLDAIHAGAVVVTEHSSGIAPLVAGEHLLVASADSLPFVVEALVRDAERLAALRTAAYERLSQWVPFALPVGVLRAAIIELVGEPVPLGVSLGTARSASSADSGEPRSGWAGSVIPATAPSVGPDAAGLEAPIATIVTVPAAADLDTLTATLDSVANSSVHDLELIIAAENADRLPGIGVWLQAHSEIAGRLLNIGAGASLGAARNVALAVVRSPSACSSPLGWHSTRAVWRHSQAR